MAFRVVSDYPGDLDTDKNPAAVTAMVLRLSSALAEHLVDTAAVRDTHVELERLVHTLPAGPYQRNRGPSQWLLRMLAVQHERAQLVPLVDALHATMRAEKVMDFGQQMATAARLALTHPEVGEQLRRHFRVVLLDEYQDTGHAQRIALSSLFGGGVDDELALTAVGDPDPVHLRLARRVGHQPAAVRHRLFPSRPFPRPHARTAHQLAQPAAGASSRQRRVGRRAASLGCGAHTARPAGCAARNRALRAS